MNDYLAMERTTDAAERIRILRRIRRSTASGKANFHGIECIEVLLSVVADADDERICVLAMLPLARFVNLDGVRGLFHLSKLDPVSIIMQAIQRHTSGNCAVLGSFLLCRLLTPYTTPELTIQVCWALLRVSSHTDRPKVRAGCIRMIQETRTKMGGDDA